MNTLHKTSLPTFLALLAALIALPVGASGSDGAPPASGAAWLPLGEVVRRLEDAGYRNIEKIEREHGLYEARATGRDGERVKLTVHPRTGEIARHGARREGALERDGRPMAPECTKRRCRDDRPAAPGAPLPAPGRPAESMRSQ
jgi:hypothetical protein